VQADLVYTYLGTIKMRAPVCPPHAERECARQLRRVFTQRGFCDQRHRTVHLRASMLCGENVVASHSEHARAACITRCHTTLYMR